MAAGTSHVERTWVVADILTVCSEFHAIPATPAPPLGFAESAQVRWQFRGGWRQSPLTAPGHPCSHPWPPLQPPLEPPLEKKARAVIPESNLCPFTSELTWLGRPTCE